MPRPVVGIIAEYNPFHNGHVFHIARTRSMLPGAAVVCVMSGHVTQRGSLSVCRKQARAAMAISGGADLVLELPALYSCDAAECFALAGVALFYATGVVTHLSFGSESGCLEALIAAAGTLGDPAFAPAQAAALEQGLSYPAARQRAFRLLDPASAALLDGHPNDMLGVEYLCALRRLGGGVSGVSGGGVNGVSGGGGVSGIAPIAVRREGASHDAPQPIGRFATASYVRAKWLSGQSARAFVPAKAQLLWKTERDAGRAPVSLANCETAVMSALRRMAPEDFRALPGVSEGLEHRLARAASRAVSPEEFYALVKTKRYTHARIRRIALRAYMDLPHPPAPAPAHTPAPPYLRVLAANRTGLSLLRDMKKAATLPIITKPASARRLGDAARDCFLREARVTDLYALCYPERIRRAGGQEWTEGPYIDDNEEKS
ncbi:MAG: nucleotidyltransferase family protein [Oscillospiraceae bacterium]|nr:nucleotidyltransferase family protein [Oscillospiraceae bacterium]